MMTPDALGDHVFEQKLERRHQREQHRELADLDPEIEAEQRGDEMVAGELELLAQRKGKAEAMDEPEREGIDPAPRPDWRRQCSPAP